MRYNAPLIYRICDIDTMLFNERAGFYISPKRICDLVLTKYMQFTFIYSYEDDDE